MQKSQGKIIEKNFFSIEIEWLCQFPSVTINNLNVYTVFRQNVVVDTDIKVQFV